MAFFVLVALAVGASAAGAQPINDTRIVPDITYEAKLAVVQNGVQRLALWGCYQWRYLKSAIPDTVNVTMICERNCTKRAGHITVCSMPAETFDMILLDSGACFGSKACVAHRVFDVLSGPYKPKVFSIADWNARVLDVLELPSYTLRRRWEEQEKKRNEAGTVFVEVYEKKSWGPEGGGSGWGSTMENTAIIRKALVEIVKKHNITSIVDAPCGSLSWMPAALKEMPPEVRYTGMDVACPVIAQHRQTYAAERNWDFYCVDVCHQRLPPGIDLVFSRDALQHLPHAYTFSFLNEVKRSGAKYLLVGSYIQGQWPNTDIKVGEYFEINLTKAPFDVRPDPITVITEGSMDPQHGVKHMLLYDVAAMTWNGYQGNT